MAWPCALALNSNGKDRRSHHAAKRCTARKYARRVCALRTFTVRNSTVRIAARSPLQCARTFSSPSSSAPLRPPSSAAPARSTSAPLPLSLAVGAVVPVHENTCTASGFVAKASDNSLYRKNLKGITTDPSAPQARLGSGVLVFFLRCDLNRLQLLPVTKKRGKVKSASQPDSRVRRRWDGAISLSERHRLRARRRQRCVASSGWELARRHNRASRQAGASGPLAAAPTAGTGNEHAAIRGRPRGRCIGSSFDVKGRRAVHQVRACGRPPANGYSR